MLAEVTVSAEAATIVKNEVQVVKDKAQTIVEGIGKEKIVAEAKLEAAKPALEEAKAALNVRPLWLLFTYTSTSLICTVCTQYIYVHPMFYRP